jgi:hypothetical protein
VKIDEVFVEIDKAILEHGTCLSCPARPRMQTLLQMSEAT